MEGVEPKQEKKQKKEDKQEEHMSNKVEVSGCRTRSYRHTNCEED